MSKIYIVDVTERCDDRKMNPEGKPANEEGQY